MEMFADQLSRGGVLEPEGTVEIKYRKRDQQKTMWRVDQKCRQLVEKMANPTITAEESKKLAEELKKREDLLLPMYHQVAVHFADLHDTPGRMEAVEVISGVLEWKKSREFFYWRIRRRLLEEDLKKKIRQLTENKTDREIGSMMSRWFAEEKGTVNSYQWEEDKVVVEWLSEQLDENNSKSLISENLRCLKREHVLNQVRGLIENNPDVAMDSIVHITQHMTPGQRSEVSRILASMES